MFSILQSWLILRHTSSDPLYSIHLTFYAIQYSIILIIYILKLYTSKNYKKLILRNYTIQTRSHLMT